MNRQAKAYVTYKLELNQVDNNIKNNSPLSEIYFQLHQQNNWFLKTEMEQQIVD